MNKKERNEIKKLDGTSYTIKELIDLLSKYMPIAKLSAKRKMELKEAHREIIKLTERNAEIAKIQGDYNDLKSEVQDDVDFINEELGLNFSVKGLVRYATKTRQEWLNKDSELLRLKKEVKEDEDDCRRIMRMKEDSIKNLKFALSEAHNTIKRMAVR